MVLKLTNFYGDEAVDGDPDRGTGKPDPKTAALLSRIGAPKKATRVKSATRRGGRR